MILFREVSTEARRAVAAVSSFEDKVTATMIRIMVTLFLGGYFKDTKCSHLDYMKLYASHDIIGGSPQCCHECKSRYNG